MQFDAILAIVLERHPQVIGMVFCDDQGEMVAYNHRRDGSIDDDQLLFAGAMCTTWIHAAAQRSGAPIDTIEIRVTAENHRFLLAGLREGYNLTAVIRSGGLFGPVELTFREKLIDAINAEL